MIDYISTSFSSFFAKGFVMYPVFILIIVGCIIQLTKVIIDLIKYKRFFIDHVFSSWWFPSFHSWIASSVTMLVLLEYWFWAVLLAVAFAFAVLFSYDAMNLRYEAGQHARYINTLRAYIWWNANVTKGKGKWELKERIGHTPIEVIWWVVFGSVLTFLFYYRFYIA